MNTRFEYRLGGRRRGITLVEMPSASACAAKRPDLVAFHLGLLAVDAAVPGSTVHDERRKDTQVLICRATT